eukprot:TRINITY_DN8181_c0_g1_i1.p1 TRINITY_DN8181_c0_g1~~TRINITY_DN8181_c0_g1_i1.p1  ORF type:complete len:729 (-),score=129.56 TRINITY_DN8181_c0_g1_i1:10-2196(-)
MIVALQGKLIPRLICPSVRDIRHKLGMATLCFRCVAILAVIATVSAWSFVPISDELLVETSHSAIVGTVEEELLPGTFDFGSMRHYKIRIERELRTDGRFRRSEDNSFVLHINGGFDAADRSFYYVPGAPEFEAGERAIFFIHHDEEKDFHRLSQFALGIFRQVDVNGQSVAFRPHEIEKRSATNKLRKFDEFADWIEDLSRVQKRDVYATVDADYFVEVPTAHLTNPKRYNVFVNMVTLKEMRWPTMPITYLWAGVQTPFQQTGGGHVQFNIAAKQWNDQPNTPIQISLGGHHVPLPEPSLPLRDGLNSINFDDIYDQIPGRHCSNVRNEPGGILSLSGIRLREAPSQDKRSALANTKVLNQSPGSMAPVNHQWRGKNWTSISEADINVQNGLECYLSNSQNRASNILANILTHELGHALGLDHSCEQANENDPSCTQEMGNAIMFYADHQNRFLQLFLDDHKGIEYLYGPCFTSQGGCDHSWYSDPPMTGFATHYGSSAMAGAGSGDGSGDISSGEISSGGNSDVGSGGNSDVGSGGNSDVGSGGNTEVGTGGNTEVGSGGNTESNSGGNTEGGSGGNTEGNTEVGSGANSEVGSGANTETSSGSNSESHTGLISGVGHTEVSGSTSASTSTDSGSTSTGTKTDTVHTMETLIDFTKILYTETEIDFPLPTTPATPTPSNPPSTPSSPPPGRPPRDLEGRMEEYGDSNGLVLNLFVLLLAFGFAAW